MIRIACFLAFVFGYCGASAQINVTASFGQDTVLIGEIADYTISIKVDKDIRIYKIYQNSLDSMLSAVQTQFQIMDDSTNTDPVIADYEIMDYGYWNDGDSDAAYGPGEFRFDTTATRNEVLYENTFRIKFWEPGVNYMKHVNFDFAKNDTLFQYPVSGYSEIFVAPPFDLETAQQDSISFAPNKPILREKRDVRDFYPYIAIAAILALFAFFGWLIGYMKKRKEEKLQELIIIRPAHEIAFEKLSELKNQKLWETGDIKEYQSQLTYAIREYLENRYEIKALESTTDEIVNDLSAKDFDGDDERNLLEILQVADLVKFAKATPSDDVHQRFLDVAFSFVDKTKEEILEEEQVS